MKISQLARCYFPIAFRHSEVKGPVMNRLQGSHFLEELTGKVHLTQYDAVSSINPDLARNTLEKENDKNKGYK